MDGGILRTLIFFLITSSVFGQDYNEVSPAEVNAISKKTVSIVNQLETCSFMLVKREWVDGRDTGYQFIQAKVNVKPIKVYLKFYKPARLEGREVLYLGEDVIVRKGGTRALKDLVVRVDPRGVMAMEGNKYPITHINPKETCNNLIKQIQHELQFAETRIYKKAGVSIYKQQGIHYKLIHTTEAPGMRCMSAEMIISDELDIPIYFKVVGWNRKTLEEYAFQKMRVNVKFGPEDFSEANPEYGFQKDEQED